MRNNSRFLEKQILDLERRQTRLRATLETNSRNIALLRKTLAELRSFSDHPSLPVSAADPKPNLIPDPRDSLEEV